MVPVLLASVAFVAGSWPGLAYPQGRKKARDSEPAPNPMAEIEKLRAQFEQRLTEQEAAAKAREDAIRKQDAAAVEAARDEADKRMAADHNERQAEVLRLQRALDEAAAREDARERNAPPSVGAATAGLSLYGYVQADYQMRQSSEDQLNAAGRPVNDDRFMIRRARLGAVLDRRYGEGRIEIDGNTVNGPTFRLLDAEASAKLPGRSDPSQPLVKGTIGMFRIPFGQEVPQDDRYRLFMERTTAARAFFPGEFDLGARLSGGWQFVRYVLAVQNGQPIDSNSFAGLDPNHQKDVLGRVGVEQTVGGIDVVGGISGLRGKGFHSGSLTSKPTLQWNDSNQSGSVDQGEVAGSPGISATPSSSFTRIAFGADLALSLRLSPSLKTSLVGELYLANDLDRAILPADPNGIIGRDFREMGYYVSLVQEYRRWRLGVRYDYYNPDQDANKNAKGTPVVTNASYSTLAVVAACVAPWGRLLVEYDRNRNHLGLDLSGMPTNLADDAIRVRGEVSF
jgi:hypothetical protein